MGDRIDMDEDEGRCLPFSPGYSPPPGSLPPPPVPTDVVQNLWAAGVWPLSLMIAPGALLTVEGLNPPTSLESLFRLLSPPHGPPCTSTEGRCLGLSWGGLAIGGSWGRHT